MVKKIAFPCFQKYCGVVQYRSMKKKVKQKLGGLSLRWDRGFIRNLIIVIGVVGVWRGIWDLMDSYFFPGNQLLSDILSILLGLALLYLPDGSWHQLGDCHHEEDDRK